MSADNGIYILETYGPEYRVVYAQAIDNVFGDFDDECADWKGSPEFMKEYFGEAKVYTSVEEAWDEASLMAEKYEYLEDGICLIRNFNEKKFNEFLSEAEE